MRLSVIIPTLDEEEHVARAIDSAWACGAMEVIVADGGSTDSTMTIAQRQGARVIISPRGRARQQNAGAAEAQGDVFLFLHADNWLGEACRDQVQCAARNGCAAGAFRQHIEADGWMYRLWERGNAARVRWLKVAYGDQGILIRRALFERLGGFPDVQLMEDVLLMRKVRRLGTRPILLPGPLHVSPRRWKKHGVIRQTLRNWSLLAACCLGVSPNWLARFYRTHGGTK